jgi:hypothetical protein
VLADPTNPADGYTDHQGLIRRLTIAFEEAWPRIEAIATDRKKQARLSVPRDLERPKGPKVTSVFKYGGQDRHMLSKDVHGNQVIQCHAGTGRVYTQRRFVHEAVHAAQHTLGLLDDMARRILELRDAWEAQGGTPGLDQHDFYTRMAHEDMWYEHEAVNVALLEGLRLEGIHDVYDDLLYEGMYLRYPKEVFLSWAQQHGVDAEKAEAFVDGIPVLVECLLDRIAEDEFALNSAIAVRQLVYPMIMAGMDPVPPMETALACVERIASESRHPMGTVVDEFRMEANHLKAEGRLPLFTRSRLGAMDRNFRFDDIRARLEAKAPASVPGL